MLDLWLPLLLLFIAATVGAIVSRRSRDRCLIRFGNKDVVLHMNSGKWLWGNLQVFPKQMELLFDESNETVINSQKATYLFYDKEIENINRLFRPSPSEDSKERKKWEKEIEAIAHPSLIRKGKRHLFNLMNTLRDAVSQSIGMILGTLKTKTAMGKITGADKRAGEISATLLGTVPNAYEPVLEKYLSKKVVVEMVENGAITEYVGLLEEYSEKYLLLRDVLVKNSDEQPIQLPERCDIIFPRSRALVRHRVVSKR